MQNETKSIHFRPPDLQPGNRPLVSPVYQSVKFTWESYEQVASLLKGENQGYFYSRVANPTVAELESLIAGMQGRDGAVAFASGSGAISSLMFSRLKAGDHVVLFRESYKPTRQLIRGILHKFGVRHSLLGIHDIAGLEEVFKKESTKLVVFESPTNPMLCIADIAAICALAAKYQVTTVMDNTFAGFHNHGGLPIDFFVHSLTKFASGHGDVMGGMVVARRELIDLLFTDAMTIGCTLDPHAAFLILRGMKTYHLRYRAAASGATEIANGLSKHPAVRNLRFPGLNGHPDYHLASRQMQDFGTMIAFDAPGSNESDLAEFLNRLKIFKVAASLGSPESLVAPCKLLYGTDLGTEELTAAGIGETTVRLSIGLEHPGDLLADLLQALK